MKSTKKRIPIIIAGGDGTLFFKSYGNYMHKSIYALLKGKFKGKLPHTDILKKTLLWEVLEVTPIPNIGYRYLVSTHFFNL